MGLPPVEMFNGYPGIDPGSSFRSNRKTARGLSTLKTKQNPKIYPGGALAAGASLIHTTKIQNRYPAEKEIDHH